MDWVGTSRFFGTAVLSVVLIYVARRKFFPSAKPSRLARNMKNNGRTISPPLAADDRKHDVAPLQTNSDERDKIMKATFKKNVAEENWDAIVIGSGIGGLATAALLSKAGLKVLVLEKHGKAGGACHIFKSEGYEFDVGIHYIGEFTRQSLTKTLLDQISAGQIQWQTMDKNFDQVVLNALSPGQRQYNIPAGAGEWKRQLKEQFPQEEKAIDRFFELVKSAQKDLWTWMIVKTLPIWVVNVANRIGLCHWFSQFFKLGRKSLKQVVEELTDNTDLRALLTYSWGCYATVPSKASFALHSSLVNHYEKGASYPVGGASEIPYQVIPIIERAGGKVMMKAPVQQILTDGLRVTGVRVGISNDACDVHAPIVISDAGIHNTFLKLLPEQVACQSPCYRLARTMKPGIGSLSIFIGLRGTTEELGLKAENVWAFTKDPEKAFDEFNDLELSDALYKQIPCFFVGFPSAKDPSWNDRYPGRSTITVVTYAPYQWFDQWANQTVKKRDDDYKSVKEAIGQQIVDQVCHLYPELKSAVDHVVVGTPITNVHYLTAHEGCIYGMDHPLERFQPEISAILRPETDIEGLYLSGQDIMSSGFVSALYSGLFCASSIVGRNLYFDLIALHNKLKAQPRNKNE